ncbi:hypothetical protein NDU88_010739 [Pleurodeles waltl]|uniref:Uncharacterized protein n=1 Tax=Pleurodeles waltl TaxID=8319 RepID=A0AAV7S4W0_PLEWA|nr:hypothetical protein NDU88_010739 [Pleurodeles waltl]
MWAICVALPVAPPRVGGASVQRLAIAACGCGLPRMLIFTKRVPVFFFFFWAKYALCAAYRGLSRSCSGTGRSLRPRAPNVLGGRCVSCRVAAATGPRLLPFAARNRQGAGPVAVGGSRQTRATSGTLRGPEQERSWSCGGGGLRLLPDPGETRAPENQRGPSRVFSSSAARAAIEVCGCVILDVVWALWNVVAAIVLTESVGVELAWEEDRVYFDCNKLGVCSFALPRVRLHYHNFGDERQLH